MDYLALGKILKDARVAKKLKQADIAKILGVTFQNVSSWELGKSKIDVDTLLKMCNVYEVDFAQALITADNGEYTNPKKGNKSNATQSPDTYTAEEKKHLDKYRQLTERDKIRIDERMEVYLEEYAKEVATAPPTGTETAAKSKFAG